jgi:hypothetical protein
MRRRRQMLRARSIFRVIRTGGAVVVDVGATGLDPRALRLTPPRSWRRPIKQRRLSRLWGATSLPRKGRRVASASKRLLRVGSFLSRRYQQAIVRAAAVGVGAVCEGKARGRRPAKALRLRQARARNNSNSAGSAARAAPAILINAGAIGARAICSAVMAPGGII